MSDKKLKRLLADAQKAYNRQDKRKGAQYINDILKEDFNYRPAWDLLYKLYGVGQSFENFQRTFAEKYYPDQAHLLISAAAAGEAASTVEKKPSYWQRLFGRNKQAVASKQPPSSPEPVPTAPEKPAAVSAGGAPKEGGTGRVASILRNAAPRSDAPAQAPAAWRYQEEAPKPIPSAPLPGSSAGKIRVMVVDDIAQTRENVVRSLHFQENIEVVGYATNGQQAIQVAKETKPDVIIMDVNMPDMDGITATNSIRREVPYTQIVILTVQDDVDYIRRAMLAGARDFLTKPPMIDELVAAVMRANQYGVQERASSPEVLGTQTSGGARGSVKGHVITVYSPRGGIGCTMLASNLAGALHTPENQVVLVDGSLQFGDVPVFFNVKPKNTILDLATRSKELDLDLVDEVLTKHDSGIKLLAPPRPEEAEQITGQQFADIIKFLGENYPITIIDTSHRLSDVTLAAFDHSDLVLLITSQDIPSLARARKFFELAPLVNLDRKRILSVLNPFDKRIGITPEKISQTFQVEIGAVVPLESITVVPSVNRGIPFMLHKELQGRPVARAMQSLVDTIRQRIESPAD